MIFSEDKDEETICFYGESDIDDIECIPEMNNDSKYYSTILFYLPILSSSIEKKALLGF